MDIIIHVHVYEYTHLRILQYLHLDFSVHALMICVLGFFLSSIQTFFILLKKKKIYNIVFFFKIEKCEWKSMGTLLNISMFQLCVRIFLIAYSYMLSKVKATTCFNISSKLLTIFTSMC